MANNKKKVVMDYSKKEKKSKEFLLYDTNLFIPDLNGTLNGKDIIGLVKKYGKTYLKVKNTVTSL